MGRKGRCGAVGGKEGAPGGRRARSCSRTDVLSHCDHTPVTGSKRARRVWEKAGRHGGGVRRRRRLGCGGGSGAGHGWGWHFSLVRRLLEWLAAAPGVAVPGPAGRSSDGLRVLPVLGNQNFLCLPPQAGVRPQAPYSEVCYSNPTGSVPRPQSKFPKFPSRSPAFPGAAGPCCSEGHLQPAGVTQGNHLSQLLKGTSFSRSGPNAFRKNLFQHA